MSSSCFYKGFCGACRQPVHTVRGTSSIDPVLRVIGAAAVNQGVKAVAVARSYLQEDGLDVACFPSFVELVVDGEERTALRLEIRKLEPDPDALAEF